MGKTKCFTRLERVKKTEEIQTLFKIGQQYRTEGAKLFVLENELGINRIAFTLKKNLGNAIQRNYSKRISREVYRNSKEKIKSGFDLLLLVYSNNDDYSIRNKQIESLFKKAGLMLNEQNII